MKPGVKMIPIPQDLAPETYIGGGCGLVTALHAVDMAEIRLGESVAVLGVGPVGQSVIALSSLSGAGEIIAVDAVADRLEYSKRMGATQTVSLEVSRDDRLSQVRSWTGGRGADVVIEASGYPEAVSEALDIVRDGGRVVVCGHYTDSGSVEINPHVQINRKHVDLRGCWGSKYEHFHRAVEIAARFGADKPWREMVSATYRLEDANVALTAVANRSAIKALITP
jgi:L-iditol 2-dehydrogenase